MKGDKMIDYTKIQADGIFFEGEHESYLAKGFSDESIQKIRAARGCLASKMKECDKKGITEFKVTYNDCAEAFPK